MQTHLLIAFFCVLFCSEEVFARDEHEIKRGSFPFMAFLYYPDDTVVDSTGTRFLRGAVLIRPDWLISSAIDHSMLDNIPLGFPRKTLLARMGAVSIDTNFTYREDEDEQEREVIQIVRPSTHKVEIWWFTDITLLKTLMPFNLTSAVAVTPLPPRRDYTDKNCLILVYTKRYGNTTEEKVLMQLSVEMLTPARESCGNQFNHDTMTCALDTEDIKNEVVDPDFCQGNSGGPLMCQGEVMGLQTYIENSCREPHLYQLLSSWESFISCGTTEKCQQDYCSNICVANNKDELKTSATTLSRKVADAKVELIEADTPALELTQMTEDTVTEVYSTNTDARTEDATEKTEMIPSPTMTRKIKESSNPETASSTSTDDNTIGVFTEENRMSGSEITKTRQTKRVNKNQKDNHGGYEELERKSQIVVQQKEDATGAKLTDSSTVNKNSIVMQSLSFIFVLYHV